MAMTVGRFLRDHYILTSNRESGFGRHDIMLEPTGKNDTAVITH